MYTKTLLLDEWRRRDVRLVAAVTLVFLPIVQSQSNHTYHTGNNFCLSNSMNAEYRECPFPDDDGLLFFLCLFVIIAWGAFVRTIIRMTKLSIPYTVILMITGLMLGWGTRIHEYCNVWSKYTRIARQSPKIILYTFLPALIFESAFTMNAHIFMKSMSQILILALLGVVISVLLIGFLCKEILMIYGWDYPTTLMYGAVISANDPVTVVAILKELGTSEKLSILIEGASLINDGVAILLYEIFRRILEDNFDLGNALLTAAKITFGSPALGYILGRIFAMCLQMIYNDAASEIAMTLFSCYLAYWVGEALGVSGVISVVILGVTLRARSTCISPPVQKIAKHFWETIAYLANTVLFVMVGITLSETAVGKIDGRDCLILIFLYIALNLIRLIMVFVLMPWLSRLGYGLNWREAIVSIWGGLRGAVGLCLSLEVFYSSKLCLEFNDEVGPKFLFHTAGIVLFTLSINGTTTNALMTALHLTDISAARKKEMKSAIEQIIAIKNSTIAEYRVDIFLADADWKLVEESTQIKDPYKEKTPSKPKLLRNNKVVPIPPAQKSFMADRKLNSRDAKNSNKPKSLVQRGQSGVDNNVVDKQLGDQVDDGATDMSTDELQKLTEEARLRLLKALKVSFWRQYEQGMLGNRAVETLINITEEVADYELVMIRASDFKYYFGIHGFYNWLRIHVVKRFKLDAPQKFPAEPENCRKCFYTLAVSDGFALGFLVIVILNMIPAIWEIALEISSLKDGSTTSTSTWQYAFTIINLVFVILYLIEFIIKVVAFGICGYFMDKWNWIDAFILLIAILDISIAIFYRVNEPTLLQNQASTSSIILFLTRILRLIKISRSLRFLRFLDNRINSIFYNGYDIGKGFVNGIDDALKFLPQITQHERHVIPRKAFQDGFQLIARKIAVTLREEQLEVIRLLGQLQQAHPYVVTALKTCHASRDILNHMEVNLRSIWEDGLIDQTELSVLTKCLEDNMSALRSKPLSMAANSDETILDSVVWIRGVVPLKAYIKAKSIILHLRQGDSICRIGDRPFGIYIIVTGMVRVLFEPNFGVIMDKTVEGQLPNSEAFGDLSFSFETKDYLQVGHTVGEIGIVTGLPCMSTVMCETDVVAYHVSQKQMLHALTKFSGKEVSLESQIWRSIGMRIATVLLARDSTYQAWILEKIRDRVESSTVPINPNFEGMVVEDGVLEVILLNGRLEDVITHEEFIAPRILPRTCRNFRRVSDSTIPPRFLIIRDVELDKADLEVSITEEDTGDHGPEDT